MGRTWVARVAARALLGLAFLASGCSARSGSQRPASASEAQPTASTVSSSGESFHFPTFTSSPLALDSSPAELAPFLSQCRVNDAALSRLAERFARRQSSGRAPLDVAEITFALRAEGSPYVWPRAWTLEGGALDGPDALTRMQRWLGDFDDGGERRCGVALSETPQRRVLAAAAVDALADLDPLPVRVRSGTWVDFGATLLVPATDASVIVLGPSGSARVVPTELAGHRARARFHADRPGAFLVQLLASVEGGPRPVLEATLYADVPPPESFFDEPVPGEPEQAPAASVEAGHALLAMVNRARQSEGSGALSRESALDTIAQRHAEAMRQARRIAHDAGSGSPDERLEAAGIGVLAAGENVAHALDLIRAHRVLWASPAHRDNLLQSRFDSIGIGIAPDSDGSVWVCEVFADFPDRR